MKKTGYRVLIVLAVSAVVLAAPQGPGQGRLMGQGGPGMRGGPGWAGRPGPSGPQGVCPHCGGRIGQMPGQGGGPGFGAGGWSRQRLGSTFWPRFCIPLRRGARRRPAGNAGTGPRWRGQIWPRQRPGNVLRSRTRISPGRWPQIQRWRTSMEPGSRRRFQAPFRPARASRPGARIQPESRSQIRSRRRPGIRTRQRSRYWSGQRPSRTFRPAPRVWLRPRPRAGSRLRHRPRGPVAGRISTAAEDAALALGQVQAAASAAAGALPGSAPGSARMTIHRPKAAIRARRTSRARTRPTSLRRK